MPVDKSVEQLPAPVLVSYSAMPVDKAVEQLPALAGPNLRLQRFRRAARLILVSNSAMPVDKSVEQLPAPADSSFLSPVKPVRESNGKNGESTDSSDSDANTKSALQGCYNIDKPKRAWNGWADYRLVKTWDIGENRTQDIEESLQELYLMSSKFSTKSLELYFLGKNDEQSHAVDKSQIVASVEGVNFALEQSAIARRQNMGETTIFFQTFFQSLWKFPKSLEKFGKVGKKFVKTFPNFICSELLF